MCKLVFRINEILKFKFSLKGAVKFYQGKMCGFMQITKPIKFRFSKKGRDHSQVSLSNVIMAVKKFSVLTVTDKTTYIAVHGTML